MHIINTLEFAPYDYAKENHKSPIYDDTDEDWYIYWKRCMHDSGLSYLEPIQKRSWLVNIDTISNTDFRILAEVKKSDKDLGEELEKEFYGGIVIIPENEEIKLTTSCCGDLSNLEEWENIFTDTNQKWQMLWIGHPYPYYRHNEDYIEFSEQMEGDVDENTKVNLTVSKIWLEKEIKKLRLKQDKFIKQIEELLNS
ncbi:hypothetical protein GGR21_003767 [Dysgonomonas hofstadii]|uniref:Uncharacterized protein n=1 Tax=Dysgonomonas hofstadii TaxID=637886 RepID=A0A840CQZ4_9BACT|nr:hypothetical protein [Dysgonomonas hofstadii]MBB4037846.1 hypothetical protein [Dysgonomonas hofstadii]